MPYVFGDMGCEVTQERVEGMANVLNLLLDSTADYYPDDPVVNDLSERNCRRIRAHVVEELTKFERDFPETELSPFIHEILHVPEFLYRWNGVRNYWCFVTERFVGWMKGLVTNRSLTLETMVHSRRPQRTASKQAYTQTFSYTYMSLYMNSIPGHLEYSSRINGIYSNMVGITS